MATKEVRIGRWYFGGVAGAAAACITHPLDLIKVNLQTSKEKASILQITRNIVKTDGVRGLYNGISASILRQLTYSLARFGVYEVLKNRLVEKDSNYLPFHLSIGMASVAGACGGMVGTPADVVNVRMQNDMKIPFAQRRNYHNALHGIYKIVQGEGVTALWRGGFVNVIRSSAMTVGQLSFYDLAKVSLLKLPSFKDDMVTHVTGSIVAGVAAVFLTQPIDVLKTRIMNAKPGEFNGTMDVVRITMSEGPLAFYKGFLPAFARIAPHTTLLFVFVEQLRMNYGEVKMIADID